MDRELTTRRFKLLADENRVQLLKELAVEAKTVGELTEALEIERTLLSHHLRLLKEEGLVTCERQGRHLIYQLAPGVLQDRSSMVFDFDCCQVQFRA